MLHPFLPRATPCFFFFFWFCGRLASAVFVPAFEACPTASRPPCGHSAPDARGARPEYETARNPIFRTLGGRTTYFRPKCDGKWASLFGDVVVLETGSASVCCARRNSTRTERYAVSKAQGPRFPFSERITELSTGSLAVAIIPALMHRIPSELRS